MNGEEQLAGVMDAADSLPEGVPAHWSVYFGVDDTDAAEGQNGLSGFPLRQTLWSLQGGRMPIQGAVRPLYRAELNGTVVAESDDVVSVEGNTYFPAESLRTQYFTKTRMCSVCPWKGVARYYTVTVDGAQARNAAWTYPRPFPLARRIKGRVAFWGGVRVTTVEGQPSSGAASSVNDETA